MAVRYRDQESIVQVLNRSVGTSQSYSRNSSVSIGCEVSRGDLSAMGLGPSDGQLRVLWIDPALKVRLITCHYGNRAFRILQ